MPQVLSRYPGAKASFNLTPCLIAQIEEYFKEDIQEKDEFLKISLKRADSLEPEEQEFILAHFFMNNWDKTVKPHPRYSELLNLRGAVYEPKNLNKIAKKFTAQDFLDLQVLFNLSWFGFYYRKQDPLLKRLIEKGKLYTEDEKVEVMARHLSALKEILPLYKKLQDQGQAELTTSPFYHPILPLLYNGGSGSGYNWREDAAVQLHKARELFQRHFGKQPRGLWPSEGSVSESALELASEAGFEWVGTDEEILLQTLHSFHERGNYIYQPYQFQKNGKEVTLFFRDKKLSDLIGFSYSRSEATLAVGDFIKRLQDIHSHKSDMDQEMIVSVILDGENAWEYYEENGEYFLDELYQRLVKENWIEMVHFSEALSEKERFPKLEHIHAGSWINHNFDIWYGHEEDKQAWDYLAKTRNFLTGQELTPEKKAKAWEELYIAEGSDWFWWYGDEFTSSTEEIFDALFRNHLMNIYRIADRRIPGFLLKPIKKTQTQTQLIKPPTALLSPKIDGKLSGFYEWAGAGHFKATEPQGAMQKSEKYIRDVYFGANRDQLFLRIDFDPELIEKQSRELQVQIYLATVDEYLLQMELKSGEVHLYELLLNDKKELKSSNQWCAFESILEIALPFNQLNAPVRDNVELKISLFKDQIQLEEVPRYGLIRVVRPDEVLEKSYWSIS